MVTATLDGPGVTTSTVATRLWIGAVTLLAFGPYLVGGLRTEQLAGYGSAAVVLLFGWSTWRRSRPGSAMAPFLLAWSALVVIAVVGALWPPPDLTSWPQGDPVAGIDNWALPLALIVLTAFWCERVDSRTIATVVCVVVVAVMVFNAGLSFVTRINGSYSLTPWVEFFWTRADEGGTAVATNALGNERYTGLFNQPTEAGICYSLALLALAYLARLGRRSHALLVTLAAAALTVGGLLAVSKVVLFGGVPLFVWFVLADRGRRVRFVLGAATVLGGIVVLTAGTGLDRYVTGTYAFRALFGAAFDASTITGGRLGSGGTLAGVSDQVLATSPWFGLGAAGVTAPYDSSWLEALATTGVVGVALLGVVFAGLAVRWFVVRNVLARPESMLALCVLVLAAGASLGMPSLTGNKVTTLLWILLTCLLLTPRPPAIDTVER